jgi:hypothetical protein
MHTYNTNQPPLKLREYGRNVQKLITQLEQISDKATRTQYANRIIQVMGLLHAGTTKPSVDLLQKRWDDLLIISDYNLDIDSPYPKPQPALSLKRPNPLHYPQQAIKYRHCGHHVEQLVQKAVEITDPVKQEEMIINIGKVIKNLSATWNKDNMDNATIFGIIQDLADKKLLIDIEKLKSENNFTTSPNKQGVLKDKKRPNHKKKKLALAARE